MTQHYHANNWSRGQAVVNAISAAAEVDGLATLPAKQLSALMDIAAYMEAALVQIARGETGDDPEGAAELTMAEVNRMIEAM